MMSNKLQMMKIPNDLRFIIYYRLHLLYLGFNIDMDYQNPDECMFIINSFLQENFTPESIPGAIETIERDAKNKIIDFSLFDWLNDDIACCYIWMIIRNAPSSILVHTKTTADLYYLFFPTKIPTSTTERRNLIIMFFDLWNITKTEKLNFMDYLKSCWSLIYSEKNIFPWLDQNDENMCNWVWGYLCESKKLPIHDRPISTKEKYIFSYSMFHYWSAPVQEKKSLLLKINKAKNQNHRRKSTKIKQEINPHMNKETKNKLNILAKKNEKNEKEMLEIIIKKEFDNLKNKD